MAEEAAWGQAHSPASQNLLGQTRTKRSVVWFTTLGLFRKSLSLTPGSRRKPWRGFLGSLFCTELHWGKGGGGMLRVGSGMSAVTRCDWPSRSPHSETHQCHPMFAALSLSLLATNKKNNPSFWKQCPSVWWAVILLSCWLCVWTEVLFYAILAPFLRN